MVQTVTRTVVLESSVERLKQVQFTLELAVTLVEITSQASARPQQFSLTTLPINDAVLSGSRVQV